MTRKPSLASKLSLAPILTSEFLSLALQSPLFYKYLVRDISSASECEVFEDESLS